MSKGTVVSMKHGRVQHDRLYIQLKNGSVYLHPDRMAHDRMESLARRIEDRNGKVQLKHWIHVRKSDGTLVHQS